MAAEVEDPREPPLYIGEPAHQPLANLANQEVAAPREAGGSAVTVDAHGSAVEDRGAVGRRRALGHAGGYGMMKGRREAQVGGARDAKCCKWSTNGGVGACGCGGRHRRGAAAVMPCVHTPVGASGALCPDCWSRVSFIGRPCCARCGLPFAIEAAQEAVCGDCARMPPVYDRARAAFLYEGAGRELILAFKMADRSWVAPRLAAWLHRAAAPLLPDADLVVPVPLHRWRLLARRFNQAAVLAGLLARQADAVAVPDLLVRTRRTPPQTRLSAPARRRNVRGRVCGAALTRASRGRAQRPLGG